MFFLKKGFTLTELLAVLTIISILSAISYPLYGRYVRRGRQLEAKANLGVVYQKQLTYLSSELKFSESLKTIGAVPEGRVRYNIGTDWDGGSSSEQRLNQGEVLSATPTNPCPCHDDQKGTNNPSRTVTKCWIDPNPDSTGALNSCSASNKCYGDNSSSMAAQLDDLTVTHNIIESGRSGFELTGGKFEYYAVGCTSPSLRQTGQLDVWKIDHKKNLQNVRVGL